MQFHTPHKKNSTLVTQLVCAVLFCVFSFLWLFCFQADVIAVAQHVLSGGVTHYDRTVGAVLITLVLQILQRVVATLTRLYRRTHAVTYLPSMLVLAVISDINADIDSHFSLGAWYWVAPLVLVLWGAFVWLARKMLPFDSAKEPTGLFSRRVWVNVLLMSLMMMAVALIGNTNAVFHFRAHAEVALKRGDYEEALRVGSRSIESDEHLTMLRMYALSRRNELGERLFQYPVRGTGNDVLPVAGSKSRLLLLSPDALWRHLGARPTATMNVQRYFRALERDTLATEAVRDYQLCANLIDRDLDAFVAHLKKYYPVSDSALHHLPRYYREALTLYTHLRAHPQLVYHHNVMDEDWDNMQELERTHSSKDERQTAIVKRYGDSYWYYYFWHK